MAGSWLPTFRGGKIKYLGGGRREEQMAGVVSGRGEGKGNNRGDATQRQVRLVGRGADV